MLDRYGFGTKARDDGARRPASCQPKIDYLGVQRPNYGQPEINHRHEQQQYRADAGRKAAMGSDALGKRLRCWLRRAADTPAEAAFPDHLPDLPTPAWLTTAAAGSDNATGSGDIASALLAVAHSGEPALRRVAVEALSRGSARWWIALDETLRQRWWWVPQWSSELTGALADGELDDLCLFVAGCHHDGRIREAAVAHLAGRPSAAAVAVLALRTGD